MTLVPLDAETLPASKAMQEIAVSTYLEHAKTWLASAVEATGPEQIAQAKARITTAAEATKQFNLSREIQLDAQEMVRRAEYALGKAIRKGQAEGTVNTRADGGWASRNLEVSEEGKKMSPADLLGAKKTTAEVYLMTDGVEPAVFEDALGSAREEGNLSRANVVRKVKNDQGPTTRDQRADLIVKLANEGYSSRQMPAKVGVSEESVRQIARDYDIEIPADRSISRTRRINSTQVVVNTATALEGLLSGIELVDFGDLDLEEASQWAASLTDSTKKLARFAQQIRKATQ